MKYERPQSPFLIFDIETVPDIPLLYSSYQNDLQLDFHFEKERHWNQYELFEKIQEVMKKKEKTENAFPKTIYHMVLSICALYVDPSNYHIISGFKETIPSVESYQEFRSREKSLLENFWNFSTKYQDHYPRTPVTFSGYNIASFDLPVIEQRSLISFISCPIEDYAKNLGTSSYRYKYASDKVFDLMQFVCNYDNRNARVGLDILSRSMGLGGKMKGMEGSLVAQEYFCNHASSKIQEYCAIDVLISYGVFLSIQKFRGILNDEKFKSHLLQFEEYLTREAQPESYKELARESKDFFAYAKNEFTFPNT